MNSEPPFHPRNLIAPLNYIVGTSQAHRPRLMDKVADYALELNDWFIANNVNYGAQILIFSLMLKVALEEFQRQTERGEHEHIC